MKLKVGKYVNIYGKVIEILEIDKYRFSLWYTFPSTKGEFAARCSEMEKYLKKYKYKYKGLEWD